MFILINSLVQNGVFSVTFEESDESGLHHDVNLLRAVIWDTQMKRISARPQNASQSLKRRWTGSGSSPRGKVCHMGRGKMCRPCLTLTACDSNNASRNCQSRPSRNHRFEWGRSNRSDATTHIGREKQCESVNKRSHVPRAGWEMMWSTDTDRLLSLVFSTSLSCSRSSGAEATGSRRPLSAAAGHRAANWVRLLLGDL